MGKLVLLLCFALLAVTLTTACFHFGQMCTSDDECCFGMCHPCAKRCIRGPPPGFPIGPCTPKEPPV